jgi:hypothetical protein
MSDKKDTYDVTVAVNGRFLEETDDSGCKTIYPLSVGHNRSQKRIDVQLSENVWAEMPDPVFQSADPETNGQWFFWDETFSNTRGPYDTEALARQALIKYSETL